MNAYVVSLRIGTPKALPLRGRELGSSIASREPADGPVELGVDGFRGDRVADWRVHGGPDKAVCCYPSEHYPAWAQWLGRESMPTGAFGENLTLTGLVERDAHIGDVYSLGTAKVQICQPRSPCFKLAVRWNRRDITARMAREAISGFYFRVLEPGAVSAGDALTPLERGGPLTVAEVMRITFVDREDMSAIGVGLRDPALAEAWKHELRRLEARRQLVLGE